MVDGQENGVTNILAASLYQHQKYATLDGHVWSIHAYMVNDRFYQGLTPAEKQGGRRRRAQGGGDPPQDDQRPGQEREADPREERHAGLRADRGAARPSSASWRSRRCASGPRTEIGKDYVDDLFKAIDTTKN